MCKASVLSTWVSTRHFQLNLSQTKLLTPTTSSSLLSQPLPLSKWKLHFSYCPGPKPLNHPRFRFLNICHLPTEVLQDHRTWNNASTPMLPNSHPWFISCIVLWLIYCLSPSIYCNFRGIGINFVPSFIPNKASSQYIYLLTPWVGVLPWINPTGFVGFLTINSIAFCTSSKGPLLMHQIKICQRFLRFSWAFTGLEYNQSLRLIPCSMSLRCSGTDQYNSCISLNPYNRLRGDFNIPII